VIRSYVFDAYVLLASFICVVIVRLLLVTTHSILSTVKPLLANLTLYNTFTARL
jgi:hypothetical protein